MSDCAIQGKQPQDANSKLIQAVRSADVELLKESISENCNVNHKIDDQMPVCAAAIMEGAEEIALHLLCNGVDLSLRWGSRLPFGLGQGRIWVPADRLRGPWNTSGAVAAPPHGVSVIEVLIRSRFTTERLTLEVLNRKIFSRRYVQESIALAGSKSLVVRLWVMAAYDGHVEVLKQLVDYGVPVDLIEGHGEGHTALIISARTIRVNAVEALLKLGADPNLMCKKSLYPPADMKISKTTALLGIVRWRNYDIVAEKTDGHLTIIGLLLKYGAEVNAVDELGCTAIMHAAMQGSLEIFKLLLDHGANLKSVDISGRNLAHLICMRDSSFKTPMAADPTELLDLLQLTTAELDSPDNDGFTPFLCAVKSGYAKVMRRLLNMGCNPLLRTADGKTAMVLALEYGVYEVKNPVESILEPLEVACGVTSRKVKEEEIEKYATELFEWHDRLISQMRGR